MSRRAGFSAKAKFGARKLAPEKFLLHTPDSALWGVSGYVYAYTECGHVHKLCAGAFEFGGVPRAVERVYLYVLLQENG